MNLEFWRWGWVGISSGEGSGYVVFFYLGFPVRSLESQDYVQGLEVILHSWGILR